MGLSFLIVTTILTQVLAAAPQGAGATKAFAPDYDLNRFESAAVAFEKEDGKHMPAPGCTVFIGSSTVAHWSGLESEFKSFAAVNRGFGGSTIPEVNYYFARLVAKYKPGKIVFYAGTNDIADGHSGEQVAADFKKFLALAHKDLPGVPVYFISMSAAPSRQKWLSQYELGNRLIAALAENDKSLHYIDVTGVMRDAQGNLHSDYFGPDNLHMNKAGYAAWVPVIAAALSAYPELPAVDAAAADFKDKDAELVRLFRAGLLNSKKQVSLESDGTVYVSTGDIPAEWLRDSSAQIRPYLYFAKKDAKVAELIRGVIARQAKYLVRDPYANAFKKDFGIWEEKFELDSLTYPVIFAWSYYKATGDSSIFTPEFARAMDKVLDTMAREQDHAATCGKPGVYWYTHESLVNNGKGPEAAHTGMVWMGFRPSDDNCKYSYLIPSEMMAVVALTALVEIEDKFYADQKRKEQALLLRTQIDDGIKKYGIVEVPGFGRVFAYEVDGLGNHLLIDDANIPSLLSAPYLGYVDKDDPTYQNTRRYILSTANPNYAVGRLGSGIGSEHTPKGYIWPLSLIMQGLTSSSPADSGEQADIVKALLASDPGDHLLHESYDPDDQKKFTRPDFGWPNALFSEYILVSRKMVTPLPVPVWKH
ncbi:MAG: glycoside hydrolase family 125 protein [Cyanobacteria bacterium REEB67]|nr:glycoside hydrolase family 125 protein [Cyanobacteria bacterium REEB67]